MKAAQRRPYRLKARAASAASTGERILDAATTVFWDLPSNQISLDEVANRAGVSVQTVIRRFGGRDALLAAAAAREAERVAEMRNDVPVGDIPAAVRVLVSHYESTGDRVMRMLAEEQRNPELREIADLGRALHKAWCARVFSRALRHLVGSDHARRLAQIMAICDVYTWKLLRRDAGLGRTQTELAMVELLNPMMEEV